ncbi:MAG: phosphoesterase [Proteobacteria bacterium]|nr:phosphoesterase [Pseudomonadota bacterium]
MANQLDQITNVVHLILENRSFDHMLGFLYEGRSDFAGLKGTESNSDGKKPIKVFKLDKRPPSQVYYWPGTDPGEGLQNYDDQMFGVGNPRTKEFARATGYLADFATTMPLRQKQAQQRPAKMVYYGFTQAENIMGVYTPEMLPVLSGLAKGFAVCDHWYCSGPIHTWPNRAFAAAATSQGVFDNPTTPGWMTARTIFDALAEDMGQDWAIYYAGEFCETSQNFRSLKQQKYAQNFHAFDAFQTAAAHGTLPAYSFIEPAFGPSGNSQHPSYNVANGEQLILDVYGALRFGPNWNSTLLIITYDEHGGFYDHHPPKADAVAPGDKAPDLGFDFQRFGPRVPAVLVSPLIPAGTVFRAPEGKTIDHTSVIKTLYDRWGKNIVPPALKYLTQRDEAAPSLGDVLTLQMPRRDDPLRGVTLPEPVPPPPGFDPTIPSTLDLIHAQQVAQLPIQRADGTVERQAPVLPTTDAELRAFVRDRLAAHERYRASRAAKEVSPPVNGGGAPAA